MADDKDDPKEAKRIEDQVKGWLGDIDTAIKRENESNDSYRKLGDRLWKIYAGTDKENVPFNILFSNTETLTPVLYGAAPRPIVQRRFKSPKDNDPLTLAVSRASQRMLMFLRDASTDDYDDLDSNMTANVLDACVPGRGLMEVCYVGKTAKMKVKGEDGSDQESEQLYHECIYTETAMWNRYVLGYAKRWKDLPWLAFELYFTKDKAKEEFGEIADSLTYQEEGDYDRNKEENKPPTKEGERIRVAQVWKIWDKDSKQVLFVSKGCNQYLKTCPDPYKLEQFFPFPRPVQLIQKSASLECTALYRLYENQAEELNSITLRLNSLIRMLKVRGVRDAGIPEFEQILQGEDGVLVPTDEASSMAREGGLDKHLWLMPIDKVITVIQGLYVQRQQVKQVIYEIIGLADIMRGASQASETLGAQKLKAQFGSIRIKKQQREVARYARDLFRIELEMAARMFQQDTWARVCQMPEVLTDQAVQAMMIQYQTAAAQALNMGQQPPLPPQPITWSQILGVLNDDFQREYRIDVETNSTVDPDATEAKQNLGELMNALSQFLNGVAPLIQTGSLPMDAAKAMLLGVARQFEFGSEVEDYIRNMQPPQPPQQDKSAEVALKGQLDQKNLENLALKQHAQLDARERDLMLRENELKTREAAHTADKEVHRISVEAAKKDITSAHKQNISEGKRAADAAIGRAEQILAKIDQTLRADADKRATEKKASDAVNAEREKRAAQMPSIEALLKELTLAIRSLEKSSTARRVLERDPKTGKAVAVVAQPGA